MKSRRRHDRRPGHGAERPAAGRAVRLLADPAPRSTSSSSPRRASRPASILWQSEATGHPNNFAKITYIYKGIFAQLRVRRDAQQRPATSRPARRSHAGRRRLPARELQRLGHRTSPRARSTARRGSRSPARSRPRQPGRRCKFGLKVSDGTASRTTPRSTTSAWTARIACRRRPRPRRTRRAERRARLVQDRAEVDAEGRRRPRARSTSPYRVDGGALQHLRARPFTVDRARASTWSSTPRRTRPRQHRGHQDARRSASTARPRRPRSRSAATGATGGGRRSAHGRRRRHGLRHRADASTASTAARGRPTRPRTSRSFDGTAASLAQWKQAGAGPVRPDDRRLAAASRRPAAWACSGTRSSSSGTSG